MFQCIPSSLGQATEIFDPRKKNILSPPLKNLLTRFRIRLILQIVHNVLGNLQREQGLQLESSCIGLETTCDGAGEKPEWYTLGLIPVPTCT